MKLSLCMIVRDEEPQLARCLQSVAGVVDEIVLVDTGSTDGTTDVADAFGARVFHHTWQNDFSAARNASLEHATGDWILVLDADEVLDREAAAQLRPFLERTGAAGVQLIQRNVMPDRELCRYQDLRITRAFRNDPAYRYEQVIHEQIQPSILRAGGTVLPTSFVILHYGYAQQTLQGSQLRARRNLPMLEAAVAASPDDAYLHYQLGLTHKALGDDARSAEHLRRVLELDHADLSPELLDTLFMKLAQLELAAGRYKAAITYADRSLAIDAGNIVSLYVAAVSHLYLGQIRQAFPLFLRVRRSPNFSPASQGQIDQVIRYCQAHL